LINASVPIIAELGYSEITIEDFLSLEIGDVIELDNRVEDLIKVKVDHTPKFLAQPGKQAKKMAIQIFSTIEEGDEEE
jgi:flagellar motor switch protein FliM